MADNVDDDDKLNNESLSNLKGESTMTFVQRVDQKRRKRLRRARQVKRWMDWLKNVAGISGGFALIWIFAAVIAG